MGFTFFIICIVLVMGVFGGHIERLRGGADAERRYWYDMLFLCAFIFVLSFVVYALVPAVHERAASRIIQIVCIGMGAFLSRRRRRKST